MTDPRHRSALGALDALFNIIRERAEKDSEFAAILVEALKIPINIEIAGADSAGEAMPFIDPVAIAEKGLDAFRATFARFKDGEIKKLMKLHNLASEEVIKANKGAALRELLWEGASEKRRRLLRGT